MGHPSKTKAEEPIAQHTVGRLRPVFVGIFQPKHFSVIQYVTGPVTGPRRSDKGNDEDDRTNRID
jgi:hypothetical protein